MKTAEESRSQEQQSPAAIHGLPLEVFSPDTDPLSPEQQARWIWIFLALGIATRLVRYLLRFPLWEDETMLSVNYLDRGYLALLQPLDYSQVCPPLFLWGQLTVIKLFGFSEYGLRVLPFLSSLVSLILFRHLAGRLLRGTPLVLAVAIFAVSYPMIRYTAEAKPYGCDLFLAVVMLALLVEWLYRPRENRWLWGLAAIIGPAVGYSFPAVFVGGGISLAIGYVLWSAGYRRSWVPWVVYNLLLVAGFAMLLSLSRVALSEAAHQVMVDFWQTTFPPITQPLALMRWFVVTHTGSMLAYPVGGPKGGSTLTFLLCVAGVALLVRWRRWFLLAILLLPLGLNFVAAVMHRFPYGGHMRLSLFMAPAFCILASLGIAACLGWHTQRRAATNAKPGRSGHPKWWGFMESPVRLITAVLMVLVLMGTGSVLGDLTHPYKSGTTLRAREFARWFWFDLAHDGEVMSLNTDAEKDVGQTSPEGWLSLHLCNQRIYSRRHARGEPPRLERVAADWPLRCVLFHSSTDERDWPPLDRWLERMQRTYQLVARDRYPFPVYDKGEVRLISMDSIEVFKFIPKDTSAGETAQPAHFAD